MINMLLLVNLFPVTGQPLPLLAWVDIHLVYQVFHSIILSVSREQKFLRKEAYLQPFRIIVSWWRNGVDIFFPANCHRDAIKKFTPRYRIFYLLGPKGKMRVLEKSSSCLDIK